MQRFASALDLQRSNENASMRCNVSHRINKGPCGHPTDHVLLRRRLLTALARNLTLHLNYIQLHSQCIFKKIDLILGSKLKGTSTLTTE